MDNFRFIDIILMPLDGAKQVLLAHRWAIGISFSAGLFLGAWLL